MPTRKQRRRRAKEQRHEYVWEDAEGNELDARGGPGAEGRVAVAAQRSRPSPAGRRRLRRGGGRSSAGVVFAPIMFVTVMLLSSDLTLVEQITQTAFIVAIFVPFSYFLDGVMWRSFKKREARHGAGKN